MHSPLKPVVTSTSVPIGRTVSPATARQTIPVSLVNATAAPVPRVIEHARLTINVSAAFKSPPSDLNSYCTLVDVDPLPLPPFCGCASRLNAKPLPFIGLTLPRKGEDWSRTTHRGPFQLGEEAWLVSHSRNRARASSGRSVKRTPARPNASAHATYPVVSRYTAGSPREICSGMRLCSSSGAMVCMAMPSSLKSRIMPPVTPSKLANAGVFTLWRSEWRLSIAGLGFTAGLYFLRAELAGGWPIAATHHHHDSNSGK